MTTRKRILVIANPTAGSCSRRRLEQVVASLTKRSCSVSLYETKTSGDAERFIAKTDCAHFDAIAVAGGDGTINEVLNGLPKGGPPLAILPLGTVNVLAKEIGLPRSIDDIAETVTLGPSRPISIGEANGRRFLMMASVGLDASVVENVDLNLKRHIGKWAYLYEILKQIIVSPPRSYRLRIDDSEHNVGGVVVANGRHYAGRFVTAPTADLEKPRLDICSLACLGRLASTSYLISLALGRFAERTDVRIDEATDLEILGPPGAPLQADGELLCRLPANIRIVPKAVNLIFPVSTQRQACRHKHVTC